MDLSPQSGLFQCIWFLGQRHGHNGRGNVLGEGIDLVHRALEVKHRLDVKRRDESSFYTFKQDVGGVICSQP
ncbi:hypothetical protein TNCV_2241271 [Trichonephila clavipes]|nr:hypothetical protein TNCV_2241271 [Trichonephila clavipes]